MPKKSTKRTPTKASKTAKTGRVAKELAPKGETRSVMPSSPIAGVGRYNRALIKHGILTGPVGDQAFSEEVAPLLTALHQVLAGGSIQSIKVTPTFDGEAVKRLNRLAEDSLRELNRYRKPGISPCY